MDTVGCLLGHGPSDDIAIVENGYTGRRCGTCGLIFISPRPTAAETLALYRDDAAHLSASTHFAHDAAAVLMARHHLRYVRRLVRPGARLLEIGSGTGAFLREAQAVGYEVYGLEPNPVQAERIRAMGLRCEQEPLSRSVFGDVRFDIIYHCDVLSHFSDPIAEFALMRERLAPGGFIVFETGNGADVHPRYYRLFRSWQYPDHLYFFGRATLRELIARAGLRTVGMRAWSTLPQMAVQRLLRRNRTTPAGGGAGAPGIPRRSNLAAHVNHWLRYGAGRLPMPPNAPHTLLVTAQAH